MSWHVVPALSPRLVTATLSHSAQPPIKPASQLHQLLTLVLTCRLPAIMAIRGCGNAASAASPMSYCSRDLARAIIPLGPLADRSTRERDRRGRKSPGRDVTP